MTKVGVALAIAGFLAGCGGGACEEDILVLVTIQAPEGGAVPGLAVTMTAVGEATPTEIVCTDTGNGEKFECIAPEAGEYNVYGEAVSFEPIGQQVDVVEPEKCDEPGAEFTKVMARESVV